MEVLFYNYKKLHLRKLSLLLHSDLLYPVRVMSATLKQTRASRKVKQKRVEIKIFLLIKILINPCQIYYF
jgi:hypothetical protein